MDSLCYALLVGVPQTSTPEQHSCACGSYNLKIRLLLEQLIPLGGASLPGWYGAFVAALPAQTSTAYWRSWTRRALLTRYYPSISHSNDETEVSNSSWTTVTPNQTINMALSRHLEQCLVRHLSQIYPTASVASIFVWHSVSPWERVNLWIWGFQRRPHRWGIQIPGK